jgi:hypothetical protein
MNYSQKIQRLKDRRQGLYRCDGVFDVVEAIKATAKVEKFQQLAGPEAVKYAIGAMQAVDSEYTLKSYAEGNRVRDRLAEGLSTAGIPAVFDYQCTGRRGGRRPPRPCVRDGPHWLHRRAKHRRDGNRSRGVPQRGLPRGLVSIARRRAGGVQSLPGAA